jgi:tetratricopeptide (TPR) repeat protein
MEQGQYEEATRLFLQFAVEAPMMAADGYCGAAQAARGLHGQADQFPLESFNVPISQRQRRDAINYFHLALAVNDRHAKSLIGLAHLLDAASPERRELLERAHGVLQAYPRRETVSYGLLLDLGDVHFISGQNGQAEEYYREAMILNPDRPEAYKRLIWLYDHTNQPEAVRQMNRALSLRGPARSRKSRAYERTSQGTSEPAVWCVVANIAATRSYGPGGAIGMPGTRRFAPGTKVFCLRWAGADRIEVIGHHRGSRRLVTTIIERDLLIHQRVKLVYRPSVIQRLSGIWDASEQARERAQEMAQQLAGT